jgi:hypothetical protein
LDIIVADGVLLVVADSCFIDGVIEDISAVFAGRRLTLSGALPESIIGLLDDDDDDDDVVLISPNTTEDEDEDADEVTIV